MIINDNVNYILIVENIIDTFGSKIIDEKMNLKVKLLNKDEFALKQIETKEIFYYEGQTTLKRSGKEI